jgi:hypothetical protein
MSDKDIQRLIELAQSKLKQDGLKSKPYSLYKELVFLTNMVNLLHLTRILLKPLNR